jgi:glutamate mutase epsilon subunit|tara:strand:- start:2985 stop:3317 length:333 start_codon:yes stop_codon:yes gene_type:complete
MGVDEKEIQDQTFVISVKTFFAVGAAVVLLVGEYIVLQGDIEEAKRLPVAKQVEITRLEVDLNSKLVLQNFKEIEKDIEQINKDIEELRLKIYEDFHLMSKHEKDNYEAE